MFLISKYISNKLIKSKKINKKMINEKIEKILEKRISIHYCGRIKLNEDFYIDNLGLILCYSYSKFKNYKISKKNDMLLSIEKILEQEINVLALFYNYCVNHNLQPNEENKLLFFEKQVNKLPLPGEFIFLMNIFNSQSSIAIDINELNKFNAENEEKNDEKILLFIITFLNIKFLLSKNIYYEINLMNIKLQKDLFNYYTEVLNLQYKNKNNNFKGNRTKFEYKDRWGFNANYIVNKNLFLIQNVFINNEHIYEKTKITDNSYEFIENSLDKVFKDYQNYYNDDFS